MTILYTIGHGNRTVEDFTALLKSARIECLVDVRAYPRSRRNPQFSRIALDPALKAGGTTEATIIVSGGKRHTFPVEIRAAGDER